MKMIIKIELENGAKFLCEKDKYYDIYLFDNLRCVGAHQCEDKEELIYYVTEIISDEEI